MSKLGALTVTPTYVGEEHTNKNYYYKITKNNQERNKYQIIKTNIKRNRQNNVKIPHHIPGKRV
jgi:hypothetical protein